MNTLSATPAQPAIKNDVGDYSGPGKDDTCQLKGGLRSRGIYKHSLPGKPLITVITVVFNGAQTLRDTLESVMQQSYDNVEYIVIDGGSSDATVDILRQYDHVIDYWLSEKDGGIYDAMNKGIALCSGDYVGMLNSDDIFADGSVLQAIAERCTVRPA